MRFKNFVNESYSVEDVVDASLTDFYEWGDVWDDEAPMVPRSSYWNKVISLERMDQEEKFYDELVKKLDKDPKFVEKTMSWFEGCDIEKSFIDLQAKIVKHWLEVWKELGSDDEKWDKYFDEKGYSTLADMVYDFGAGPFFEIYYSKARYSDWEELWWGWIDRDNLTDPRYN